MGWTGKTYYGGEPIDKESVRQVLNSEIFNHEYEKVTDSIEEEECLNGELGRFVHYSAVKKVSTGIVFGLVTLVEFKNDENPDEIEVYWKEMDETMGPRATNPSKAVLDALSPTTNDYALQWRKSCRK